MVMRLSENLNIDGNIVVKPGDLEWWFEKHDELSWNYAYTMPQYPHSWVWKGRNISPEDFDRMFGVAMRHSEPGKFFERTNLYLHNRERGIRYWLMGMRYHKAQILNMSTDSKEYGEQDAPVTATGKWTEYDFISPFWDHRYRNIEENYLANLWKRVHYSANLATPTMLDIGGGTGVSLDAKLTKPELTTVVDPSQGMLNAYVYKHPKIGAVKPMTFGEYLEDPESFDLVTATDGSASYLTPKEVEGAYRAAKGLLVLQFYNELPGHRKSMPETHREALGAASALPGAVERVEGRLRTITVRGGNA